MILSPAQYASASVYELLHAAARGHIGLDRRLLDLIVARGEGALPDIARIFQETVEQDDEFPIDLEGALLAVVRRLRTPSALPFLADYARAYGFDFPDELTFAFEELGAASIDTLLALQAEEPESDGTSFALAALKARDPRILELLIALLDKTPDEAVFLLGVYGDPAALPALEAAREKVAEDDELRKDIQHAVDHITSGPVLEEGEAEDPLGDYPAEDDPYFAALDESELIEFLSGPEPAYRAQAVHTLALDEMPKQTAARIFELAKNDPDVSVRAACWEALEGSLDEPGVRDAVKSLLADDGASMEERAAALVALVPESREDESLRPAVLEFYGQPETRAQALKAMWHTMDRRWADYMAKHVDDSDPKVRRQALWGVGWLGVVSQLSKLEELFEDEEFRGVAIYSYALAAPGQTSPAYARKLFRKIEDLAGGLTDEDGVLLKKALDDRLQMNGFDPIFIDDDTWSEEDERHDGEPHPHVHGPGCKHEHHEQESVAAPAIKTGRNDPCPCGSGKKYKKCCGK